MAEYPFAVYLHAHDVPGYGCDFGHDKNQNSLLSIVTGIGKSSTSIHLKVPKNATATDVSDALRALVKDSGRKIRVVIVNAHGAPGEVKLGAGIKESKVDAFSNIKNVFSAVNNGFILYCCNTAASGLDTNLMRIERDYGTAAALMYAVLDDNSPRGKGTGHSLIKKWSQTSGVDVSAPYEVQVAPVMVLGEAVWRPSGYFKGNWVRAHPNGKLVEHSSWTNPRMR
ncbi:hypothetical protein ABVF61_25820 [Roseibium sp. HPY-6]|uniref:hypothetical protein n=1 Tax=Roseibium sp. HPY-6 TaxID=3229852 RepID=UPI00338F04E3